MNLYCINLCYRLIKLIPHVMVICFGVLNSYQYCDASKSTAYCIGGGGNLRFLHTLALLWGEREALGSVRWVSSAADAGARAAVRGAGHLSPHGRTISEGRKRGCLSPVVVSVLPGENRGNVSPAKIWKVQTLIAFSFSFLWIIWG